MRVSLNVTEVDKIWNKVDSDSKFPFKISLQTAVKKLLCPADSVSKCRHRVSALATGFQQTISS